jgi:hypothetical protein
MVALLRRHRSHLVDEYGMVGCPRQRGDVSVDHCLACRELLDTVEGPGGRITEIRCRIGPAVRSPQDHWEPFGPLTQFRP